MASWDSNKPKWNRPHLPHGLNNRVHDQDSALRDLTLLFDSCVTLGNLLMLSLYFLIYSKEGNTTYLIGCWAVNEVRWVKGSGHSMAHKSSINAVSFLKKCWRGGPFFWVSGVFGSQVQGKFWGTSDWTGGTFWLARRTTLERLQRCSWWDSVSMLTLRFQVLVWKLEAPRDLAPAASALHPVFLPSFAYPITLTDSFHSCCAGLPSSGFP